jgi:hypothetical protein
VSNIHSALECLAILAFGDLGPETGADQLGQPSDCAFRGPAELRDGDGGRDGRADPHHRPTVAERACSTIEEADTEDRHPDRPRAGRLDRQHHARGARSQRHEDRIRLTDAFRKDQDGALLLKRPGGGGNRADVLPHVSVAIPMSVHRNGAERAEDRAEHGVPHERCLGDRHQSSRDNGEQE